MKTMEMTRDWSFLTRHVCVPVPTYAIDEVIVAEKDARGTPLIVTYRALDGTRFIGTAIESVEVGTRWVESSFEDWEVESAEAFADLFNRKKTLTVVDRGPWPDLVPHKSWTISADLIN